MWNLRILYNIWLFKLASLLARAGLLLWSIQLMAYTCRKASEHVSRYPAVM